MSFMSKLWCHNAAKESTCNLWTRAPKAKGPRVLALTNKNCVTYFNDVSSLKAVELKKLCRSHGIVETYPKKA